MADSPSVMMMVQLVLGGLGLFLMGMTFMSDGIQAIAGKRLNKIISAVTDNRILAILVGVGVTGVIQSSSATTVMVIGFVNSGVMTLLQAIGVIFGANIGTTVSMWILTLNLAAYGPLIIGLSSIPFLFSKKDRVHYSGMAILGLGLLFYGLDVMSSGFAPIRDMPELNSWLSRFEASSLSGFIKAVLVGTIVTAIIQSSTAVIGIVMGMAANGILNFETSVAIIMGSNIGTTATAALACIGTTRNAQRAALSHFLFNFIGVFFVVIFYSQVLSISERFIVWATSHEPEHNMKLTIAIIHTGFNVLCTIIMLPFMRTFERFVTWCIPKRADEEPPKRYTPRFLDKRLLVQPTVAVAQAQREIALMGSTCLGMLDRFHTVVEKEDNRDIELEDTVFHDEEDMDIAQKEISEYVSMLLRDNISHEDLLAVRREIKQADEFESLSDYIVKALKAYLKIITAGEKLSPDAIKEVLMLAGRVKERCIAVMEMVATNKVEEVAAFEESGHEFDNQVRAFRNAHLQRLSTDCKGPVKSIIYTDLLSSFRRMNDHLINICQSLRD